MLFLLIFCAGDPFFHAIDSYNFTSASQLLHYVLTMSGIEKEVHPSTDQRSSGSFANGKGVAVREETAHQAAERGVGATDKYVSWTSLDKMNIYLPSSSDTVMRSFTSTPLPKVDFDGK